MYDTYLLKFLHNTSSELVVGVWDKPYWQARAVF